MLLPSVCVGVALSLAWALERSPVSGGRQKDADDDAGTRRGGGAAKAHLTNITLTCWSLSLEIYN